MTHYMDTYIRDRMIADAQRVITLAEQQSKLEHQGLKGRFRELLIDGILEPWLPPIVQCATGTVISWVNTFRSKTQEDILLIDRSISPAVLLKLQGNEGVYLRNSVVARIEVKSNLDSEEVKGYLESCEQYKKLPLDLDEDRFNAGKIKVQSINILFAFKSEYKKDEIYKTYKKDTVVSWFSSITDGSISIVCIPQHGFWRINEQGVWLEYQCQTEHLEAERLAAFVGLVSNTAFNQHMVLQGRERLASLESGVGHYFNYW
jgi:hypothetical protein